MARLVFRMLVCAGIGALGGLMMWLKGQHIAQSAWKVDAFGFSSLALGTCLLGGAGIGALFAFVLDALGLDLPLFPERQRPARSALGDLLSAPLTKDQLKNQLARLASAPPPPPVSAAESIRATVRDWSSGSGGDWIDRKTAERLERRQQRFQSARVRLEMLFLAGVLTLGGIGFTLFSVVISGGAPTSGIILLIYAIAIGLCTAVFVMGGTAWRVMAAALAVVIAYVAYSFRI